MELDLFLVLMKSQFLRFYYINMQRITLNELKAKYIKSITTVFDLTNNLAYDITELPDEDTPINIEQITSVSIIGQDINNIYITFAQNNSPNS